MATKKVAAKKVAAKKKVTKPVSNPVGRPSKYDSEMEKQVTKLCALGATDIEIADFFGIGLATLNRWKVEKPEFRESIKTAKHEADVRVERSLFARATGFEHEDVDIRVIRDQVVETTVRKRYPPDTSAAIFWLKNRKPEVWRDKIEHGVTGADGGPVLSEITIKLVG